MRVVIRREVTIEIKNSDDKEEVKKAYKEAGRYKQMGYTMFEETDNFIQLDKHYFPKGGSQ